MLLREGKTKSLGPSPMNHLVPVIWQFHGPEKRVSKYKRHFKLIEARKRMTWHTHSHSLFSRLFSRAWKVQVPLQTYMYLRVIIYNTLKNGKYFPLPCLLCMSILVICIFFFFLKLLLHWDSNFTVFFRIIINMTFKFKGFPFN